MRLRRLDILVANSITTDEKQRDDGMPFRSSNNKVFLLFIGILAFQALVSVPMVFIMSRVGNEDSVKPARRSLTNLKKWVRRRPSNKHHHSRKTQEQRCALLFFGLPRSFEALVLPSVVKNVLASNNKYNCDVYAHATILTKEEAGLSGRGGEIDPDAIYLLKQAVLDVAKRHKGNRVPNVMIMTDMEGDFRRTYNETLQKYYNTFDKHGKRVYFPWKKFGFIFPQTMDNIVKQWHSIQSVWNLMNNEAKRLNVKYTRVAMLRSDVFYALPIDIYKTNETHIDEDNSKAVIPGFALYPSNDRMIYGPYDAVKIWATERFSHVDQHVQSVEPGVGIHGETFINNTILPLIQQNGTDVVMNRDICFFRVRADKSIWIEDCERDEQVKGAITRGIHEMNKRLVVQEISGLSCARSKLRPALVQLACTEKEVAAKQ